MSIKNYDRAYAKALYKESHISRNRKYGTHPYNGKVQREDWKMTLKSGPSYHCGKSWKKALKNESHRTNRHATRQLVHCEKWDSIPAPHKPVYVSDIWNYD